MIKLLCTFISLKGVFIFAQLPSYVNPNGLSAWWSFENNALDHSNNNYDGIVHGIVYEEDHNGNPNSSIYLSGTANSYLELSNSSGLNLGSNNSPYSVAFWIKVENNPNNGAHSGVLTKWNENQHNTSYPIRIATTDLGNGNSELVWVNYHHGTGTQSILSTEVVNNRYIHIAYVVENNLVELYKNGQFVKDLVFPNFNYDNNDVVLIGKRSTSNPRRFKGNIDEMGIWDRAISQCEIFSLVHSSPYFNAQNTQLLNDNGQLFLNYSGPASPTSFQWFECVNGVEQDLIGETNPTLTISNHGYFGLTVGFGNGACDLNLGCYNSAVLELNEQINDFQDFILFPNPTTHLIELNFSQNLIGKNYLIMDYLGRIVEQNELTKSGQFVDVGNLSSGSYIFSVKGTKINKKFIKY